MAGIVAPVGVFDLDHFGAEIGQRLRAGRAGNDPGEIDDQQTVQRGRFSLCARRSIRQLRLGGHLRHFLLLFCLAKRRIFAATSRLSYRNQRGNAKPRFCRAGPAADIALKTARGAAALPSPPSCRPGLTQPHPKRRRPPPVSPGVERRLIDQADAANSVRRAVTSVETRLSYSAIISPDPPSSAGKSFSLGSPSRIGSTVSA